MDLSSYSRIHNVFHVLLLRPCHGEPPTTPSALPASDSEDRLALVPEISEERRVAWQNREEISQPLVFMRGAAEEESEWIDTTNISLLYAPVDGPD